MSVQAPRLATINIDRLPGSSAHHFEFELVVDSIDSENPDRVFPARRQAPVHGGIFEAGAEVFDVDGNITQVQVSVRMNSRAIVLVRNDVTEVRARQDAAATDAKLEPIPDYIETEKIQVVAFTAAAVVILLIVVVVMRFPFRIGSCVGVPREVAATDVNETIGYFRRECRGSGRRE